MVEGRAGENTTASPPASPQVEGRGPLGCLTRGAAHHEIVVETSRSHDDGIIASGNKIVVVQIKIRFLCYQ
jgi:hypothetical protein